VIVETEKNPGKRVEREREREIDNLKKDRML
jgi:hypothetical protein